MRFRLGYEELRSKVDIALKNDDLFSDLKGANIEIGLSVCGPSRVIYNNWTRLSYWQRIAQFQDIAILLIYAPISAYFLYITPFPLVLFLFAVFSTGLFIILNLSLTHPRRKNREGTFLLIMPKMSFLYLAPFQMEKSLLHELQHIRQGIKREAPSEREAKRIAKKLLPIYLTIGACHP